MKSMATFGWNRTIKVMAVTLAASIPAASRANPVATQTTLSKTEIEALQEKLRAGDSLRVDLVQKKVSPSRPNRPVVVKGHALFQKPDRFRWVLGEPLNEETIFNGKELYKYLPREKAAARYSAKGQQAREVKRVVDFVLNVGSIFETYKLVSSRRANKRLHLEFKPANADMDEIERLELTIDEDKWFVSRVFFSLRNKASIGVDFSSPDRRGLTPLSFAPPPGVKINDVQ
ncbi:MAG: Outer rane lipoprotein carrier protein LolA [Pseudomonadota bacterium]|jgi:outer membrane lipoprotein-sorting protein